MKANEVNKAIENWLGGQSDRSAEEWLIKEMNNNPELAQEVNLRRMTDEILSDGKTTDLRQKLSIIEMKKRSAYKMRRTILKSIRYAAIIAGVILVTSAAYLILRPGSSPDTLYLKYYAKYESPGTARSAAASENALMEKAISFYSSKDYEKAILYLEQVIESGGQDMKSVFMHGMANMEVKNYPVATGSFNRVIEHNDNLYLEDAAWYLGLCYMKTDNISKAVSQFNEIAASGSRYSKQAARLARRLK